MQFVNNFETLKQLVLSGRQRKVAVVCPYDAHTSEAVEAAITANIAGFILVGDSSKIAVTPRDGVEIAEASTPDEAAALAVSLVRQGKADVLMKGLINTDNLLRAILNKETGLLPAGNVLTHITAAEIPAYSKLLLFSDAAVIPFPTMEQHSAMVSYLAAICHKLGNTRPRIALTHCSEKTSPKFPVTEAYAEIRTRAAAGMYGETIVDGPMDVKTACCAESGEIKGIVSDVAGQADCLIFPDIEAGNTFYKTITTFGGSLNAGMLAGASAPVVLPSRSDSTQSKLCSLLLACAAVDE